MIKSSVNRISIVGPAGSGKSTLAVKLGEALSLPVYHVDEIIELVDDIAETEKWIIDGHRMSSLENRIKKSDLVIFLNFSIDFCKASVRQRDSHNRLGSPKDGLLPDGEFVAYCLKTLEDWKDGKGKAINSLAKKYRQKFVVLKTREQVDAFAESFSSSAPAIKYGREESPCSCVVFSKESGAESAVHNSNQQN